MTHVYNINSFYACITPLVCKLGLNYRFIDSVKERPKNDESRAGKGKG